MTCNGQWFAIWAKRGMQGNSKMLLQRNPGNDIIAFYRYTHWTHVYTILDSLQCHSWSKFLPGSLCGQTEAVGGYLHSSSPIVWFVCMQMYVTSTLPVDWLCLMYIHSCQTVVLMFSGPFEWYSLLICLSGELIFSSCAITTTCIQKVSDFCSYTRLSLSHQDLHSYYH